MIARRALLIVLMFGALYLVQGFACAEPETKGLCLTILHTNDLHSHDEPFMERTKSVGGMARIGHLIRTLRKEVTNPVVVDAGDLFQGTALYTLKHGEVEINLLNKIGFDVGTIGNHEFDDGPANLTKQLSLAKFPIVCANLDLFAEPALAALVKPYIVREFAGRKVAFIGATTPDIEKGSITRGGVTVKSISGNYYEPIARVVKAVKASGIDLIVLVSHCGIEFDKEVAVKIPDIDVIIGGHSHTKIDPAVIVNHTDGSSTIIVQTGCYGRDLGELKVCFDASGKIIQKETAEQLIDVNESVASDADLTDYIAEESKPLREQERKVIATAEKAFPTDFEKQYCDSAIGDLICDALYEEGKRYGATIALHNRGGIRTHIEQGPITEKNVNEVLPFDNTLVVATISGDALLKSIENGLAGYLGARFLEVHGLKIIYDRENPVGHRIVFAFAQNNKGHWEYVDREKGYRVAINDYNFKSGEGHDFSHAENPQFCEKRLSDILEAYLETAKRITPARPNRIVRITDEALAIEHYQDHITAMVNCQPGAEVVMFAGSSVGVEHTPFGVAIPLSDVVEIDKTVSKGNLLKWSIPTADLKTKYDRLIKVLPKASQSIRNPLFRYAYDFETPLSPSFFCAVTKGPKSNEWQVSYPLGTYYQGDNHFDLPPY